MKSLKRRIAERKFRMCDTPAAWDLTMQELRNDWLDIPVARRGGGDEELVEILLDKVGDANEVYVSFVRAAVYMRGGEGMDDYQGIAKMIVEQHKRGFKGKSERTVDDDEVKRASSKNKAPGAEAFAGWAENPGQKGGKKAAGKEVVCGRCGEKGHFKRDCTKTCKATVGTHVCGLKCCGGVRDPKRCMVKHGIPPAFRKVMEKHPGSREAIAKIEKG